MSSSKQAANKRPPLVETALAVQFDPLPQFKNIHLGMFWETLGSSWPETTDAPPIEPQVERFAEEGWMIPGMQLRLVQTVLPRLLIQNADRDRMIQVQNGRIGYNWLGKSGGEYPRYKRVRPEFVKVLEGFQAFLRKNTVGDFKANQWEVTYVNHIPKGSLWTTLVDWNQVFRSPIFGSVCSNELNSESISCAWSCEIKPRRGRLHVQIQNGAQPENEAGQEVIAVTLTARGPAGDSYLNVPSGLDLGHEIVVKAFKELTNVKAHTMWGLDVENA